MCSLPPCCIGGPPIRLSPLFSFISYQRSADTLQISKGGGCLVFEVLCIGGPPIQFWDVLPGFWTGFVNPPIQALHPPTAHALLNRLNNKTCIFATRKS